MADNEKIISNVIVREGGAKETNIPEDTGGRTKWGISEAANPDLWKNGPPTEDAARKRFMERYVEGPRFDRIQNRRLREQLIDFGVHSGPAVATRKLQEILRVNPDGVIGPKTLAAVETADPVLLNNRLAIARLKLLGRIVTDRPNQAKFAAGWINRAVEFFSWE